MNEEKIIDLIDENVSFAFSRSSGAGGQNVNKVSTRVTARLPVATLSTLDAKMVELLQTRLAGRINADGEIVVHAQDERSQARNREIALQRLHTLVVQALVERRGRRPTRPTKTARRQRVETKRRRGVTKVRRRRVDPHDER